MPSSEEKKCEVCGKEKCTVPSIHDSIHSHPYGYACHGHDICAECNGTGSLIRSSGRKGIVDGRAVNCPACSPSPSAGGEGLEKGTKEKLLERIDFLSDHWVNGDDKPPFNFMGWREEVACDLLDICRSLLERRDAEWKERVNQAYERGWKDRDDDD